MAFNSLPVNVVLNAPLTVLEFLLAKFFPVESISRIYFVVAESLEYLGFVHEKLITTLLESASVGATVETELLKTGETPNW